MGTSMYTGTQHKSHNSVTTLTSSHRPGVKVARHLSLPSHSVHSKTQASCYLNWSYDKVFQTFWPANFILLYTVIHYYFRLRKKLDLEKIKFYLEPFPETILPGTPKKDLLPKVQIINISLYL